MEDIGQGVIALINQIYNEMTPMTESIASLIISKINVVAAIGAILYIFGNLIKQIYYNEDINFLPYMRPFIILMLIPLSPKITDGIDEISNQIRNSVNGNNVQIAERIEKNSKNMQDAIDRKWDKIGNDEELYQSTFGTSKSEDNGGLFPIADDIKLLMGKKSDELKIAMILIIQNLLVTLMYIAEAALLLMSLCYRLVLKMGFPIVITLTIFPGFTNNLINWFGKYLNFSLLPAIAAMYSTIAFGLLDLYLSTDPVDVASGSDTQSPEFLGFAYIGILVLSLIGYLFVPSMTAMLVNVGGVGQIMGGSTRAVTAAGSTAYNGMSSAATKMGSIGAMGAAGAKSGSIGAIKGATVGSTVSGGTVGKAAAAMTGGMVGGAIGAVKGIKSAKKS